MRRLAAEVLGAYPRLDVLVNNVGGFWAHRHVTADGLERTFALNHLAPFLLTNLLLDRLESSAPARVVTVASNAQAMGRIAFDDLQGERDYSGSRAYNQSKLANVMFTYELARRLAGTGVTANALHPGRGAHRLRRRGPLEVDQGGDAVPAVSQDTGPGRRHLDLPGVITRRRGHHRPVLRELHPQEQPTSSPTTRLSRGDSGRSVQTWWVAPRIAPGEADRYADGPANVVREGPTHRHPRGLFRGDRVGGSAGRFPRRVVNSSG